MVNEFRWQAVLNPLAETKLRDETGLNCCEQISNNVDAYGKHLNHMAYDVDLMAVP